MSPINTTPISPIGALLAILGVVPVLHAQESVFDQEHHAGSAALEVGPRQAPHLLARPSSVRFTVTTSKAEAQAYFEQGVAQLHGFWYLEAERSFRQVAALDPDCAMAYWGIAMANVEDRDRARWFARAAWLRRGLVSERERQWIDALARYREVEGPDEPKDLVQPDPARKPRGEDAAPERDDEARAAVRARDKRLAEHFIKDLEELVWAHPDDLEAKALLANEIWLSREAGLPTTSRMSVEALLQDVFAVEPLHPAHHYRIHLWDAKDGAARVVDSAVKCGLSWPLVAHNWHMGGHIFARLGRHADAAWQQEASARVDHAYMARDWILPDQIHNFAHNNEWLCESLRNVGRVAESIELAKNMIELPRHPEWNTLTLPRCSATHGRGRLLETLALFERWDELAALGESVHLDADPRAIDAAHRAFALGESALYRGDDLGFELALEELVTVEATLRADRAAAVEEAEAEALSAKKDALPAMEAALKRFERRIAEARDARQALDALERLIAGREVTAALDELEKLRHEPAHLARLAVQHGVASGDTALVQRAVDLARRATERHEGELYPFANLAHVLEVAGRREEALEAFDDVRELAAYADQDLLVLQRLAPLAEARGFMRGDDWRATPTTPEDLGERVDLTTLGPAHWSPPAAPDFVLADAFGATHRLSEHHGRPVLVVFFLGFGCVHCVEQLQALGPRADAFRAAGIELLSVGLQPVDELADALGDDPLHTGYPFPVLANPDLAQFRAFRAYDDFEDTPLHGTYLVDAEGRLRWFDMSHQPFMDLDFLLAESQRLLALPVRGPAPMAAELPRAEAAAPTSERP
jgi:peroxiredoxin